MKDANHFFTINELQPEESYMFRVCSLCENDARSGQSEVTEVKMPKIPAPNNFTTEVISFGTVHISWEPIPGMAYRVRVTESSQKGAKSFVIDCGQNSKYAVRELKLETKYKFCVQAGRGNVWGSGVTLLP